MLIVVVVKPSSRIVVLALAAIGAAAGCGGHPLKADAGTISGPDGGGDAKLACRGLDEATCNGTLGCTAQHCPTCGSQTTFSTCYRTGDTAPACIAPPCAPPPPCDGLDESTCAMRSDCQTLTCPACDGGQTFFGCEEPGGGTACAATVCTPPPCSGLDETTCKARSDCRAAYCPTCGAGTGFAGCLTPTEPLPQCPATICPAPCDNFDETQCAKNGCTPLYCPTCSGGQVYLGCNGPGDVAGCGSGCVTSCTDLTEQGQCDARSDCHSVFVEQPMCDCTTAGCCATFSRCDDGGKASCKGPAGCFIAGPYCDGKAFVLSYTASCYEGCVRPTECAP
jgi:hypothetical protein